MKRLFVGVRPPQVILDYLEATLQQMRIVFDKSRMEVQWVPQENWHITLCFLGDIEDEQENLIIEHLKSFEVDFNEAKVEVSGFSAFPNTNAARVIFADVKESRDLISLQTDLEEGLKGVISFEDQKTFRPHITLGRIRKQRNVNDVLSTISKPKRVKSNISNVTLFQSTKGTQSSYYQELYTASFSKT